MTAATPVDTLQTIADFIRWGMSRFNAEGVYCGHGTNNALDEAVWLVLHALHLPPDTPNVLWHTQLLPWEKAAVYALLQKRIEQRIPAAYLTGEAWFAGLKFHVTSDVLIPRSPLAELIEQGFTPWLEPEAITDVLDLCTGSGCIAIAIAAHLPQVQVDATDISPQALAVAADNVAAYGLETQVNLVASDVFDALAGANKQYDLIISNPPYVDVQALAEMPAEYHHEPQLGLAAGDDGLDIVRRILQQAREYLKPNGVLIVEVGASQAAIQATYPDLPLTWLVFERGGEGVFLLTVKELQKYQALGGAF